GRVVDELDANGPGVAPDRDHVLAAGVNHGVARELTGEEHPARDVAVSVAELATNEGPRVPNRVRAPGEGLGRIRDGHGIHFGRDWLDGAGLTVRVPRRGADLTRGLVARMGIRGKNHNVASTGRIVVADRDPALRRVLTTRLEAEGYEVRSFEDLTGYLSNGLVS